jgi:hypothetical protein
MSAFLPNCTARLSPPSRRDGLQFWQSDDTGPAGHWGAITTRDFRGLPSCIHYSAGGSVSKENNCKGRRPI